VSKNVIRLAVCAAPRFGDEVFNGAIIAHGGAAKPAVRAIPEKQGSTGWCIAAWLGAGAWEPLLLVTCPLALNCRHERRIDPRQAASLNETAIVPLRSTTPRQQAGVLGIDDMRDWSLRSIVVCPIADNLVGVRRLANFASVCSEKSKEARRIELVAADR